MQFTKGVELFIQAWRRAGAAKLIEVGNDTAFPKGCVIFGIDVEYPGGVIPFLVGIAPRWRIFHAINVKGLCTHVLNRCSQYAAVSAGR